MCKSILVAVATVVCGVSTANADHLFSNGPVVTNPTGGTGSILGQPVNQQESGAGMGRTDNALLGYSLSDDFTVTGPAWNLDMLTVYAYESLSPAPVNGVPAPSFINAIHVNLWTSAPYSANSPPPIPDPLPKPVLAQSLVLPVLSSSFVSYETTSTSNAGYSRPIYAFTVSLDDLPNGGVLSAGTYWMEWSLEDDTNGTNALINVPQISPRAAAFNANARQYNSIDNVSAFSWFEPLDPPTVSGLPMAFPFELGGTVVPEPATGLLAIMIGAGAATRRRK